MQQEQEWWAATFAFWKGDVVGQGLSAHHSLTNRRWLPAV